MPILKSIKGLDKLLEKLRDKVAKAKADGDSSVAVGYEASYAVYVHENMEASTLGQGVPRPSGLGHFWGPSDYGPKFLEGPARVYRNDMRRIIVEEMRRNKKLAQALVKAGLKLQRESQLVVPVEYGVLKNSAFTKLET